MKQKVILIFLVATIAFLGGMAWLFVSGSGNIRDGYFPRDLILRQSLTAFVHTIVFAEKDGTLVIREEDLGENLNSASLREQLKAVDSVTNSFLPITSTVEERASLGKDFILFDEAQGQYVDELGNPIYLVFFGDKSQSYGNRDLNLLARRYQAAAWVVGKDGTNQYGRSNDGFFVGYTRDGEREYQPPELSWWKFWER